MEDKKNLIDEKVLPKNKLIILYIDMCNSLNKD